MPRPPALYRIARLLGRLGVVALVLLLGYVALTVYSASQLSIESGAGGSNASLAANVLTVSSGITLANHGILPVTSISLSSIVRYPDGTLLAVAHSPLRSIPPSTNATIPLTVAIPLTASSEALALLTHSVALPANISANVTFGGILDLRIQDTTSLDWGAPFDSLTATAGTPVLRPNGTIAVPFSVSYTNRAAIDEVGALAYTIKNATGATCTSGAFPVNVPQGTPFNVSVTLYLPRSCDPSGGTADLSFSGGGFNLAFPPEPLP